MRLYFVAFAATATIAGFSSLDGARATTSITEQLASPSPSPKASARPYGWFPASAEPLRGRVVDPSGRPISFADLKLSSVDAEGAATKPAIHVTTDASGAFEAYSPTKSMTYKLAVSGIDRQFTPRIVDSSTISGSPHEFTSITLDVNKTNRHHVERVVYVTDRNASNIVGSIQNFGGARSTDGVLQYGTAKVSIPNDHRLGELERPWSFFGIELPEDPTKHVVLREARNGSQEEIEAMLRQDVTQSKSGAVFLFVHGFNVSFADAIRRTAQLRYDLNFDGPAIAYTWPSQGTLWGYPTDETNIEWTQPHLEQFLRDLARRTRAKKIDVIAHSMGNRALLTSLANLTTSRADLSQVNSVALCAPDIDQDVFRAIVARIGTNASKLTLYASDRDQALLGSQRFHSYPRAGQARPIVVLRSIATIDASAIDTDLTGHGYYGDNTSVIADIWSLIRGVPMPRFHLQRLTGPQGLPYWRFTP